MSILRFSPSPTVKLRLYGVIFLVVLGLLLSLTVAVYQQVFTPVVKISLQASSLGNQLQQRADVKLRGLIVGEVREVRADGKRATLDIALKPSHVKLIPSDVHAQLLPKTLFGEKYVNLVVPKESSARPIQAGDVITQDRTKVGMELQRLMADLLPLLRAVEPGKLNATLSAFATALEGRGNDVGENFVRVEDYLRKFNPHMPKLQRNISQLADVAEVYGEAAPDLLEIMRNTITNSRTLMEKRNTLESFLTGTTTAAGTGEDFLDRNADHMITLGRVSRPTLALLSQYSPVYPCLLDGLEKQHRRSQKAWSGGEMRITLEVVAPRKPYQPGEEPEYGQRTGPHCAEMPNPPVPAPEVHLNDGTSPSERGSSGRSLESLPGAMSSTAAEQRVMNSLVAPVMGVPADEVPSVATLLFGPMARGTEVSTA